MSSKQKGFYMILAGIVILALKLSFNTGLDLYGEYQTDYSVGSEFQAYTLNYFYGANTDIYEGVSLDVYYTGFQINIFSNIIGYGLIIIGTLKLKELSKLFSLTGFMSWIGMALYILIKLLPFFLNGYRLCYIALFIGIAELFATLSVMYLFVYAVCTILNDVAFKQDRAYIGICYIGTAICMIVVAFINWLATVNKGLVMVYEILCLGVIALLIYNLYKVKDFILKERGLE